MVQGARPPQQLLIRISDQGPGVADLDAVLEGRYRSSAGLGMGIVGAKRLLHHFDIVTGPRGTTVELGHRLPERAPAVTAEALKTIVAQLSREREDDPMAAMRQQNQELLQSLEEIRRRQLEAEQLSRELADTNRGVVALYAELDARAEQLRQASDTKSRFLSSVSHEFRTPLNSMMALCALLLEGVDGDLTSEQRRQIGYIRKSAHDLLDMVNDLLDLAKVEAGKIDVKSVSFSVEDLFGGLRGALRPLRGPREVDLIFESAAGLPSLDTDEGKVAQVLRNLISNALKFTERGEVRVSAHYDPESHVVTFAVADTGIGICADDRERIFDEFFQVDGQLQRKAARHRPGSAGVEAPRAAARRRGVGGERAGPRLDVLPERAGVLCGAACAGARRVRAAQARARHRR